jgi:hypothetical protein
MQPDTDQMQGRKTEGSSKEGRESTPLPCGASFTHSTMYELLDELQTFNSTPSGSVYACR